MESYALDADAGTAERRMIMDDFLRCKDCKYDIGKCLGVSRRGSHKNCFEPKVMTNADRIRDMSDEELSDFLAYTWATSARAWQKDTGETLHWLKQRSEGE